MMITPSANPDTQLFRFEADFVRTLRCIPMCVRFKLDRTGVKLSLRQWSRFTLEDRERLRLTPCAAATEVRAYGDLLLQLVQARSGETPAMLPNAVEVVWNASTPPDAVVALARARAVALPSDEAWSALSELQRYAVVKLTRDAHENANFVPAMREFGLTL